MSRRKVRQALHAKNYKEQITYVSFILLLLMTTLLPACAPKEKTPMAQEPEEKEKIKLPEPRHQSDVSVEEALLSRRSVREYTEKLLTLAEVSQLLWAAQGITDPRGFRTAPSAGALYPLEVYLVVGRVKGLSPGIYKYNPQRHEIFRVAQGDRRAELSEAALGQEWVKEAAIDIVFTAVYERTTGKYGERGYRYVHMEAGHAGQNIYLQAEALGLGTVVVGAFRDAEVKDIVNAPDKEQPLYVIPIGRKK